MGQSRRTLAWVLAVALVASGCGAVDETTSTTEQPLTLSTAHSLGPPSSATGSTTAVGRPAIASWASGRLDVFVTGADHQLWHIWFWNGWQAWESWGKPTNGMNLNSPPAAVSWGPNRLDIFVIGQDQRLYHCWWNGTSPQWEMRGNAATTLNQSMAPAVSSWGPNRLDIFAWSAATPSTVQQLTFDTTWPPNDVWKPVDGPTGIQGDISAVSWGVNRIDLVGQSGSAVDHRWWVSGGTGSGWSFESLATGGTLASAPTVTSRAYGLLDVLFKNISAAQGRMVFDKGWPASPESSSTSSPTAPTGVSWGPGRVDLVWTASDGTGAVWHNIVGASPVATQHNDIKRSGANTQEVELNVTNVNANHFGMLYRVNLDGEVYAQPLYQSTLAVPGFGTRNVVYVATTHNSVYMLDADTGQQLYKWPMDPSAAYSVPLPQPDIGAGCNSAGNLWEVGITSTPVLDTSQQVLFVETFSSNILIQRGNINGCPATGATYKHTLRALRATDLQQLDEIDISPTAAAWEPNRENQRAALLKVNNRIYVAFAGHVDAGAYRGWLFEYTFVNGLFSPRAPTGQFPVDDPALGLGGGGIWQSGNGPSSDGTNVYLSTGNGGTDTDAGPSDQTGWNNSVLKFGMAPLTRTGFFAPSNSQGINRHDLDVGSTGPVVVTAGGVTRVLAGSKLGAMWLLDPAAMPGFNGAVFEGSDGGVPTMLATEDNSECSAAPALYHDGLGPFSNVHGAPVYLVGSDGRPTVYVWGEEDYLRAYTISPTAPQADVFPTGASCGDLQTAPYSNSQGKPDCPLGWLHGILWWNDIAYLTNYSSLRGRPSFVSDARSDDPGSSTVRAPCGMPGGILSATTNAGIAGTGIIWATVVSPRMAGSDQSAITCSQTGTLYAFDASNVSHVLWSSDTFGCGVAGNPCCSGNTCAGGLSCTLGVCNAPPGCGLPGQTCCTGSTACSSPDNICNPNNLCSPNALGLHGKFVPPTIANGRVYAVSHGSNPDLEATGATPGTPQNGYVATTCPTGSSNAQLVVYGLFPSSRYTP